MKEQVSKMKSLLFLAALITVLGFHVPAHAQEGLDDLLALDIESLANIEVSVASKQSEKIADAPGIITVVTRKEIDDYGAINLLDVLSRVPSMQVAGSTFFPTNVVSMRGQSNQHYSNRILFLINGRPFRDQSAGGWNIPLFTQFPLNNIEQIEIIRGPGSVLYGTNAFSGLVNIITRKAASGDNAEASVTYGSYNHRQATGRASYVGDGWSVVAAINKSETDGDEIAFVDENGVMGSFDLKDGGHGLSIFADVGNFSVEAFSSHVGHKSIGSNQIFTTAKVDNVRQFLNASYSHEFESGWTTDANITYNRTEVIAGASSRVNYDNTYIGELTSRGELTDNLDFMLGGTAEYYDGYLTGKFHDFVYSAYAQVELEATDWMKLVGGVQINDSERFKVGYSPRFAAILNPHHNWGGKILYGQAFRAPVATEVSINFPGILKGGDNVSPETIETVEGQIFYQDKDINLSIAAYKSRIQDIIGRIPNPSGPGLTIANTGEQVFKGIEIEGKAAIGAGWSLQSSANFQYGKSDMDIYNPTFYPNWMAKIGLLYDTDNWSFGLFNSTYGDPEDIRGTNSAVSEVNAQPKGYNLVSANLNIELNSIPGLHQLPDNTTFTLYGENLLDEDIDFPDFNRQNVNSFPIAPGRAVFGRLTVRF